MKPETEFKRILRRLKESSGRRLARRNAREELKRLFVRVQREFPSIHKKTGEEIRPKFLAPEDRKCPCGSIFLSTGRFASHLMARHDGKCPCGFAPKSLDGRWAPNEAARRGKLRAHLDRNRDRLATHLMLGALGKIGGPDGNELKFASGESKTILVLPPALKRGSFNVNLHR